MKRCIVFLAALSAACGAPSPEELAEQTSADVRELLRGALSTANQTNNWQSVDEVLVSDGLYRSASERPKIPDATQSDRAFDEYSIWVRRIFTESNQISPGLFGLTGSLLCGSSDGSVPGSEQCISQVDSLKLKIKVTAGPDLTLLVGPDNIETTVIRLRSKKSIAFETNFEAAQRAARFISATLGEDSGFNGVTNAKGRYELKLEKNGTDDYSVSLSVLDAISMSINDRNGIQRSFSIAARSPTLSARLEGPARRITATVDVGTIDYSGLLSDWGTQTSSSVPAVLHLAGLTGQLEFEEGKAKWLRGVGLGDGQTTFTAAGSKVLSVDFNTELGRKVDLSWAPDSAGLKIEASKGLEVVLFTGLQAIAGQLSSPPAPQWQNSTYTVSYSASSGLPSIALGSQGFKLVNGTLRLSSNDPQTAPRAFQSPTCLKTQSTSSSMHALLDSLVSTSCP